MTTADESGKIGPDTPLMEGITIMQEKGIAFDIALQLMVDMDSLQKHLAAHAMTGQIYDLKEQPIYLLALATSGWFHPELMGDLNDQS